MRIAIFLENKASGGFHQSLSTIEPLMRANMIKHDFVVFTPFEKVRQLLLKEGIEAVRYGTFIVRLLDQWDSTVVGGALLRRLRRLGFWRLGRHLDALLDDYGVNFVVFTNLAEGALRIGDHPFIVTLWDVNQRDHQEFSDVYGDRVFERVDRVLRATLTRAVAVIANSTSGARRIVSLYHVDPNRIIELPFVPALAVRRYAAGKGLTSTADVQRKYDLPEKYIFYPAYFAFHKNHLYLLEGLVQLEQRHGVILHAVFCGADNRNIQKLVMRQAEALGLTTRVKFLEFVPDDDIPALYQKAVALVMPTYFGPTNLPPLEAVTLGCPVIYSDLPEFREQMGDAALYCNLADSSSLADQLAAVIQDPELIAHLRNAGAKLAAEIAKIDYGERLASVFDNYAYVRRRWTWPETPD